jgi:hypothetical protein
MNSEKPDNAGAQSRVAAATVLDPAVSRSEAGFPTPLDEYKPRVARKVEEMRRHDGIIRMGRLFRDQHAQVGRKRQHLLLMFRGWHSARVGDVCADGP